MPRGSGGRGGRGGRGGGGNGRSDPSSTRPGTTGTTIYDDLVGIFSEMMDKKMEDMLPKVGVVRGGDGRKVRVALEGDDEAGDSEYPSAGGRMNDGDSVALLPVGHGNYVALGPILSQNRPDVIRIGPEDIMAGAIERHHIAFEAVGQNEIAKDAIRSDHIKRRQITGGQNGELSKELDEDIPRQQKVNNIDEKAGQAKSTAKDAHDAIFNKGGLISRINDLEDDVKKLENKKKDKP